MDRFIPGRAGVSFATRLARRPDRVARRAAGLAGGLARAAAGSGDGPARGDRRFADPAWTDNPVFSRLVQGYLAAGRTLDGFLQDARLDVQDERRVRFALESLHDAAAPSNYLLTNPVALRTTVQERGANLVRGARNLAGDMASSPRLPASVDTEAFEVGVDVAATPGSVVLRTELFELIQYAPQTDDGPHRAGALRPADGQQVLPRRPGARAQPGRGARALRPAGVRALVAQPGRRAARLDARHLRGAACSRRSRRSPPSPAATASTWPATARAARWSARWRRGWPRAASSTGSARSCSASASSTPSGRARRARSWAPRSPSSRSRPSTAAATSTARRCSRSSPGCGRTT